MESAKRSSMKTFVLILCIGCGSILLAQCKALQNGQLVASSSPYAPSPLEANPSASIKKTSFWKQLQQNREARRYHNLERKAIRRYHKRLQTRKVRKRMRQNLYRMGKNSYQPSWHPGPSKFGFRWR